MLWLTVYESGVHATIAGVVMGLLTPAVPRQTDLEADEVVDVLENRGDLHASDVRMAAFAIRGSISACDRLIDGLHPWTSYVIVPLFAVANAGVELDGGQLSDPSAVFVGVFLGLVVGKLVGISAFSWLAVRTGLGRLPGRNPVGAHRRRRRLSPGSASRCPCSSPAWPSTSIGLQDDAKVGTLAASIVAALAGWAVFSRVRRPADSVTVPSAPPTDGC